MKEITREEDVPQCSPQIEPCEHGNFKASCACNWKVYPRFRTFEAAERAWATHAQAVLQSGG